MALGIAANSAIFTLVDAWLLRPLPLKDPQRLVSVWRTAPANPREPAYFDFYRDYLVWASTNRTLEPLAATFSQDYAVTGAGEPDEVHGAIATWNLFPTVGASAALGRVFEPDDVLGEPVCVVSDGFWQAHLGAAASAVGQQIALNETSYRIVGVLPPGFSIRILDQPFDIQVWTLIAASDPHHTTTSITPVAVIGRLRAGATRAQAESDLNALQADLNRRHADEPRDSGVLVAGLQQDNTRTIRSSLLLLFAAVAALLLIACVNAGSLIVGRTAQRATELAVRLALGCSRRRLFQQLTTEVLVLFIGGGVVGLGLAMAFARAFVAWNPLGVLPAGGVSVDITVVLVTAAALAVAAVAFGSIPAMRALRRLDQDALRSRAGTAEGASLRSRMALVAVEITLSVELLVTAGLLISSFARVTATPLGFETDGVHVGGFALPLSRYASLDDQTRVIDRVQSTLRQMPWLHTAAVATSWPFQANGLNPIEAEGRSGDAGAAFAFTVGSGYFETLGIARMAGRDFDDRDRSDAPPVAVINEALARLAFAGQDPIGRRLRVRSISRTGSSGPWLTVIGVVGNTRTVRYNRLDWNADPVVYTSIRQRQPSAAGPRVFETQTIYVYIRAPQVQRTDVAAAVHAIDPLLPLQPWRRVADVVSELRAQPRLRAIVLGAFAALTLLVAMVGIYGVMTQLVEQRRRELGIRIALGATPPAVIALVMRRTLALLAVGTVAGAIGAAASAQLLRGVLLGVSPLDPVTFTVAIAALGAIAVAASYGPARRATRIDPNLMLRAE